MVERVATHQCCADEDAQVFDNFVLTVEVLQLLWSYAVFEFEVAFHASHIAVLFCHSIAKLQKKLVVCHTGW